MKKILSVISIFILSIILVSCGGNAKKQLEEAKEALVFLDTNLAQVQNSFELYNEGLHGSTIEWKVDNPEVAIIRTVDGSTSLIPNRPTDADVKVILTATITIGKNTIEKEFEVTILKLENVTVYSKFSEFTQVDEKNEPINKDKIAKLENITVVGTDTDAYYVSDGSQVLLVFQTPSGLKVGDKGIIIGTIGYYFGAFQFSEATLIPLEEVEVSPTELDLKDMWIDPKANSSTINQAKRNPDYLQLFTFEALILERTDFTGGGNYQLTLVGKNSDGKYDVNENFILSYYKSNLHHNNEIQGLSGKVATFTGVVRELRDARDTVAGVKQPVWSFSILSYKSEQTPDSETKASVDSVVTLDLNQTKAGTMTLPNKGKTFDSDITWSYTDANDANNQYINLTNGAVTLKEGSLTPVLVKITATATIDGKSATANYVVNVGDYSLITIEKFLSLETNAIAKIEGVVTSLAPYNSFSLEDATGAVAFRINGKNASNANLKVGDKISVVVKKALYKGLIQAELVGKQEKSTTEYTAVKVDLADIELTSSAILPFQSRTFVANGLEVTKVEIDKNDNYIFSVKKPGTSNVVTVKWDSRVTVKNHSFADIKVGDLVNLDGVTLSWNNGPSFMIDGKDQIKKVSQ